MQPALTEKVALAQAATAAQPVHVRGTIVSGSSNSIVVNTGSATQKIAFGQHTRLVGVVRSSPTREA
jgi:hypothetical protein